MNANASLNSLILRRGKAGKMCVGRFNALHVCLSHTSMLQKQSAFGKDYLSPVKQLAEKLQKTSKAMTDRIYSVLFNKEEEINIELSSEKQESSMNLYVANAEDSFLEEGARNPKVEVLEITNTTFSDRSISSSSSSESYSAAMPDWKPLAKSIYEFQEQLPEAQTSEHKIVFDPKYILVGDNVDIRTQRQHYLIEKGTIDRHFFNLIVVRNRVSIPDKLIGIKAAKINSVLDIPLTHFLPSELDEVSFRKEVKILVSRELVKYFKELSWMKKLVVYHIPHEHSDEAKEKSEVVSVTCFLLICSLLLVMQIKKPMYFYIFRQNISFHCLAQYTNI